MPPLVLAMLASGSGPIDQLMRSLFDDTFAGIHQLEWFDWALLVPYFALLGVVSVYGLHRFALVVSYYRNRRKIPQEPPARFETLPRVTVQLPLYNERFVAERLIQAVTRLDYPRNLLQIQVLDDSTDDTHPFTAALAARLRAQGHPIEYHHRDHRDGFKAGALQAGMATATGELIAIFDADFLPPPDFLQRTVHYFSDPAVGVVQTRWSYLNRHYSLLTEIEAMLLDGHFVLEHNARQTTGLFFNFNGTAGLLRRAMIEDAGGWEHDTLTEDSDLSYRAQLRGWRFVYLPQVECPSELPIETFAFQVQQFRWSKGLTQCALKLLPAILRSPQPWRRKLEAWLHLTPNIAYPLMVIITALLLPVMIVRFYMGWLEMVLLDLPLILANFASVALFYVAAHRELYPKDWKRAVVLIPFLFAAGVGLTINNTRAVLEALLGVKTGFVRTAKYAVGERKVRLAAAPYRRRSGWLPFAELALGVYFLGTVAFAIDTYNFFALPFLLLFVIGYFWTGFSTLYQEHQGKLRWQRELRLAGAARRLSS